MPHTDGGAFLCKIDFLALTAFAPCLRLSIQPRPALPILQPVLPSPANATQIETHPAPCQEIAGESFMKAGLLQLIRCPDCGAAFSLADARSVHAEIISGTLDCHGCHASFLIQDGLPVILRPDRRSERTRRSFGKQWKLHEQRRFERETIYGKSQEEGLRDFQQAFAIADLGSLKNCVILDAGCGSGALTADIGKAAPATTVVGVDFSESARLAHRRCRDLGNVHIIQADLSRPPLAPRTFDLIWSEGVIHHTPDTQRSFSSLAPLGKTGGKLYIWIYSKEVSSPYRVARKILRRAYLLPQPVLYALAWTLALPVHAANKIREALHTTKIRHRLASTAYSFYDVLSPEFMHCHSSSEVTEWFRSHGYGQLRFSPETSDIAVCGTKR
jgi:SAM-dependent methyltransferase